MKLRIVETPKDVPPARNQGTWDCLICAAFGTGGVNGWNRHYAAEHYGAGK